MTAILGISAFYHDSAAALVVDGEIVAAAQEERFTRKKHDEGFPQYAVEYCLAEAGLKPEQLDYVGFYDKPFRKFERLLETYLSYAPAGYRSFRKAMPLWLKQKLYIPRELRKGLGRAAVDHLRADAGSIGHVADAASVRSGKFIPAARLRDEYKGRFVFTEHHESHAASAFFPSPFEDAAILTMDGVGEWSTVTMGFGRSNSIELTHEIRFPHSPGLLYSAFTYYAGFKVNSGEYKLMGLAPYGEPQYRDLILNHLLALKEDGSFHMDMSYFNYCQGLTMTSQKFHKLFGGPPRQPEAEITQKDMDIAASVQSVTEEIMLRMARHAHRKTGSENLVLAGGVALNCVGNGKILRDGPFQNLWIQPASGDAGGALGTALFIWHQLLQKPRTPKPSDSQKGSFLGPEFHDDEIRSILVANNAVFATVNSDDELCDAVATLLAEENVIGWFQGRMEFGPRALGARSLLGDARSGKMQSLMNLKIKFRESFRPFAPIVLQEHVHEYFEIKPGSESPYMLLVAPVHERIRSPKTTAHDTAFGIEKLRHRRSEIPAVTHIDYSARVQTIDAERNPLTHRLLTCFKEKTGCPVLINTSFNVRSEPIICTPEDALRCFLMTDMDVLVLGHHILKKADQENRISSEDRRRHLSQYTPD